MYNVAHADQKMVRVFKNATRMFPAGPVALYGHESAVLYYESEKT